MADPATSAVLLKAAPYVATIGGTISFNRTSLELKLQFITWTHCYFIFLLIAPVWN